MNAVVDVDVETRSRRDTGSRRGLDARRLAAGALVTLGLALTPASARADGEAWLWTEHQVRVIDGTGDMPRTNVRFMSNARFSSRAEGLDFGLARLGPVFAIAPWFTLATTGAAIGLRSGQGAYVQEYRGELDMVPHTKLGDFALSSRNRFEYIWRDAGPFTRYRNMVRVSYAPKGAEWIPFAFFDLFLRPTGNARVQETWTALGVGRVFGGAARLDVAYMLRTRDGNAGELDHVTWLMMFFGVPEPKGAPTPPPHDPVGGAGD